MPRSTSCRKAATASPPVDDDDAIPTDAEFAQLEASAHALLAEVALPPHDTGTRLPAWVAAGAAAVTKLAA
jgi:hypothetical protein